MVKEEGKWEPIAAAYANEADAINVINRAKASDGDPHSDESSEYEEALAFGMDDEYDEGNPDHPPRYKLLVLEVQY
jgi:hypothetical protein